MAKRDHLDRREKSKKLSVQEIERDAAGLLEWLLLEKQADNGRQFSGQNQRTELERSVSSSPSGFRKLKFGLRITPSTSNQLRAAARYSIDDVRHTADRKPETDSVCQDKFRSDDQTDEREELYIIAAQKLKELSDAARADRYDSFSPSAEVDSSTVADCYGLGEEDFVDGIGHIQQTDSLPELVNEIAEYLKSIADGPVLKMIDSEMKTFTEPYKAEMYERFKQTVQHSLGSEISWNHLAVLFYSVKGAVSIVGRGTTLMSYAQEITLRYFGEQYAAWVLDQGGFESLGDRERLSQ